MEAILRALQEIPKEVWHGLLGTLAGALIAFIGVAVTNSYNRKNIKLQMEHDEKVQRQRHRRAQLEEVYMFVSNWVNGELEKQIRLSNVINGLVTYKDYVNNILSKDAIPQDFNRLDMIINIHGGKEVSDAFLSVIKAIGLITALENSYKQARQNAASGEVLIASLNDLREQFQHKAALLKLKIAYEAKQA